MYLCMSVMLISNISLLLLCFHSVFHYGNDVLVTVTGKVILCSHSFISEPCKRPYQSTAFRSTVGPGYTAYSYMLRLWSYPPPWLHDILWSTNFCDFVFNCIVIPRPCINFRNKLRFLRWGVFSPKLEYHPLLVVHDCILNMQSVQM
jgi:hypothetical protein